MTSDEKLDRLGNEVHQLGLGLARVEGGITAQNALLGQYRHEIAEAKTQTNKLEGRIWGIVIAVAGFGLSSIAALVMSATLHTKAHEAVAMLARLF